MERFGFAGRPGDAMKGASFRKKLTPTTSFVYPGLMDGILCSRAPRTMVLFEWTEDWPEGDSV